MSDNELILHPEDPFAIINDVEAFTRDLHKIGFLGETFNFFGTECYRPGIKFYELIRFLEERTTIIIGEEGTRPEDWQRVPNRSTCFVQIRKLKQESEFWFSFLTTSTPFCLACGNILTFETAKTIVHDWHLNKSGFHWTCPHCSKTLRIQDIDWDRTGGFGRASISIMHVHFREAIPSKSLLDQLQTVTQERWTYFYSRI